jgi:hypothetical protein
MTEVAFLLGSPAVLRPGHARDRAEEKRTPEDGGDGENFNQPAHGRAICEFTATKPNRPERVQEVDKLSRRSNRLREAPVGSFCGVW